MEKILNSSNITPSSFQSKLNPYKNLIGQEPYPLLNPDEIGKIGKGITSHCPKEPQEKSSLTQFYPIDSFQLLKDSVLSSICPKHYICKELTYKLYKTEARLVRSILEQSKFTYTDSHDWNLLWLGAAPQLYLYENLHDFQRINHFPNSFEITKKDRMSVNLKNMQQRFPSEYDFFPETYVIPEEYSEFYHKFQNDKGNWIVKPCNSSQGKGIFLLDTLQNLPSVEGCVVSRYIGEPLLINGLKFDLRIYVLVTSYEPLRIYLYDEGLVRFASEPYTSSVKASKYSFLTNYSINKKNEKFIQNTNVSQDNCGHKWSLSALMKYLSESSFDTSSLLSKIYDLVIKTMISIEPSVVSLCKKLVLGRNNCFDLLGFDIIIDSNLKPWLLEVNLSPSLATDSPLDLHIKSNLISDTLNLIGIKQYDRKKECLNKLKARIQARKNQMKQPETKLKISTRPSSVNSKVSFSKYKLFISDLIEEESRIGNFVRIFPCQGCEAYEKLFLIKRKSNKAMLMILYTVKNEEPESKNMVVNVEDNKDLEKEEKEGLKIVITGDDILIEYLSRVMHAIKSVGVDKIKNEWKVALEAFVGHSIWDNFSNSGISNLNLLEKINLRISEMKENRVKLKNSVKESYLSQKHQFVRRFSALQLEGMIKSSNKSLTREVTSILFFNNSGILTEIIKWLASSSLKKPKKSKTVRRTGSISTADLERVKM